MVCIYRLCRFFLYSNNWRCKLAYAVPYNLDALYLLAINALHLVNIDFLNKLANNLGCELFDISVLADKTEEAVNIKVGYYTEVFFPGSDIRFIAINNGVDSANQQDSDFKIRKASLPYQLPVL